MIEQLVRALDASSESQVSSQRQCGIQNLAPKPIKSTRSPAEGQGTSGQLMAARRAVRSGRVESESANYQMLLRPALILAKSDVRNGIQSVNDFLSRHWAA